MKTRFEGDGPDARRRRTEAIQKQEFVLGSVEIAEALEKVARIEGYQPGENLIEANGKDNHLHLLLCGSADVLVNGQRMATRRANQHVGEMATIDPTARRSATVRAVEETVSATILEADFTRIAELHPILWRRLALELADRLRQRAAHVKPVRERPVLLVASSREGLATARAIQTACSHDPWVTRLWTDGVFGAGRSPLESLGDQLSSVDFGIVVVTADDVVSSRGASAPAPRDNTIFELGLLLGALGRERAFIARSLDDKDLKLPSDLVGVQPLEITAGSASDLASRVGPAVSELRGTITGLGGKAG